MRVPGAWRTSAGGVPVPPVPTGAARCAKIARIRSSLPRAAREGPRYVPVSPLGAVLPPTARRAARGHQRRRALRQVQRRWPASVVGRAGRTLESVLEYIEGGNTPRLEYPAPPSFSRLRGSSWTPRRMVTGVSSSSSGGSPCLHLRPVKSEPQDTPVSARTRSSGVLVEPKVESSLPRSTRR
ncbi:hypothetical protein VPH35_000823 [Triticum aestivum]